MNTLANWHQSNTGNELRDWLLGSGGMMVMMEVTIRQVSRIFMIGKLGVAALNYLAWTFMNYSGLIFAISHGYRGFVIAPRIQKSETKPGK